MRNGIECRKRHSLMRNRSITFSVNCPQLNPKKTKYEVYDIYEIEIGDVCRCQKIIISLYHHTIYVMSVEEESVYFLVFTVARVAGPKTGGGEGGKSEGNPHPPSLFLFESPTLSTLPRRLFVQLRPKRRTKQPLMCRSKSLAFIRPLTCVDVLVC